MKKVARLRLVTWLATMVVLIALLAPGVAVAQGQEPPCRFYGTVRVDGAYVPDGTQVTATIDGMVLTWTTTTKSSSPESVYVLDVPGDDSLTAERNGGAEGDVVRFNVRYGGRDLAAGAGFWHQGMTQEVNLQASTGGSGGGGGGGGKAPTEPTKPPEELEEPEESAEPAEPVVLEPTPPAPGPTPPVPTPDEGEGGIDWWVWLIVSIGGAAAIGFLAWFVIRRRMYAGG